MNRKFGKKIKQKELIYFLSVLQCIEEDQITRDRTHVKLLPASNNENFSIKISIIFFLVYYCSVSNS